MDRTLVIGIGNPERGDDAAGLAVAAWLAGRLPESVAILTHDGEATSLLTLLGQASAVYLVDACVSGVPAGTIRRFDVTAAPLPRESFAVSTHGLGLADAIELARALDQLPAPSVVYAIEGRTFEPGASLSPAVGEAIARVGDRLRAELDGHVKEPDTDA
ncbi:hydrogenase maturation protease [Modicisalibacter sp. 'Wilcox']|uniref:hydrogenase maturation protease n=1 Tax=Modicisalibacter sp. 'Wilcox' TaxID=2679914 RepID=UPI0013D3B64A|nr:hydrogenase maturation protease [Modicisalibacter sp. 'Wilcox']